MHRAFTRSIAVAATATLGLAGALLAPSSGALATAQFANWHPTFYVGTMSREYNYVTPETFSSPAIGHICGAAGSLDAVAGYKDGTVRWWTVYGSGCNGWFTTGQGAVQSSPVLYDFNNDGYLDVLVTNDGYRYTSTTTRGRVVVFSPHLSNKVLFSAYTGDGKHNPGDFATPTVYKLNGDPDIIEPSWDEHLHVWDERTGKNLPGSPFALPDTAFSSPTVAVVNGAPQIFFGDDCAGVVGQGCYPKHGGYLYDVHWYGGKLSLKWRHFLSGEVVWSSPAVADLNKDGKLDVVVGTGNMPCTPTNGMCGGHHVYAMNASTGAMLTGWPVNTAGTVTASPAVGPMGIGRPGMQIAVVDNEGYLYVFGERGGSKLWSKCLPNMVWGGSCTSTNGYHESVSLANIGGRQSIVATVGQHVVVLTTSGTWTYHLAYLSNQSECAHGIFGPFTATPTVVSLNGGASILDAAICADATYPTSRWHAGLLRWDLGVPLGTSLWPTFKRGFDRSAYEL